mmetsp:Transcript_8875/g.21040  ORF Transcript_8875/g.21040 Transcript_8875/m.21040 type:complete len:194 (-) Transcript_8875:58-639(-)
MAFGSRCRLGTTCPAPRGPMPHLSGLRGSESSNASLSTTTSSTTTASEVVSLKRQQVRQRKQQELSVFLREHRCEHVNEPQSLSGCFGLHLGFKEVVYPIHLAARRGDARITRLLLAEGADPSQKTSKGRTALDIAIRHANKKVQEVLENPVQAIPVRDIWQLAPSELDKPVSPIRVRRPKPMLHFEGYSFSV